MVKLVVRKTWEKSKYIGLYKKGLCDYVEYSNELAKRHGYQNHNEFKKQIKFTVLKLVQLKQDWLPLRFTSTYTILKQLPENVKLVELRCNCCGEKHEEFLTLDHINNNGAEHRREVKGGSIYHYILTHGFCASDYQVLCWNCNAAIGFLGYCPHHPEIKREPIHHQRKSLRVDNKLKLIDNPIPLFDE